MADLLRQRDDKLPAPVQMCDGLSRNLPEPLATIAAHCLSHARREFADLIHRFPDECWHVLQQLALVYAVDKRAKDEQLSPKLRLELHQQQRGPVMRTLHERIERRFAERRTEPNFTFTLLVGDWRVLGFRTAEVR